MSKDKELIRCKNCGGDMPLQNHEEDLCDLCYTKQEAKQEKSNLGRKTKVGTIIYENERCAVTVDERTDKIFIGVLQKKDGQIYYPLGFLLGANGLDYDYPK